MYGAVPYLMSAFGLDRTPRLQWSVNGWIIKIRPSDAARSIQQQPLCIGRAAPGRTSWPPPPDI